MSITDPRFRKLGAQTTSFKLGRYTTPEGLSRSGRIAALTQVNIESIPDPEIETVTDPVEVEALDGIVGSSMNVEGGGRRKKKQRGGGPRWEAIKSFAARASDAVKNSIVVQYLQDRIGETVIEQTKGIASVTAKTADQVLITIMSLFALAGGLVQFTIGTTRYTLKNISSAASSASSTLASEETQAAAANKITAVANLPMTIAVAIAALTQAGIISLTAVVAVVLRGLGAATTGTGRAAATVAFYTWYLGKNSEEQKAIREKGAAVASATAETATTAIGSLKEAIIGAPGITADTVLDTTPLKDEEKGEAAIRLTGAAIKVSETVKEAEPVAKEIIKVIETTTPGASGEILPPGVVPKPEIPGVTEGKIPVVKPLLDSSKRATRSSAATGKGGKKKTKKRQPKRRVTRRKPRVVFAY